MPGAPRIRLDGVERRWNPRVAVRDLSLTIEPGERIALVGPSGSGKTTLLRLLMGALRTTAGKIHIGDSPIEMMTPAEIRGHRRRCAVVDQGITLIPQLTVHGNVIAGKLPQWPWWKTLASLLWSFERDETRELLDHVGLADRQWDKVSVLSGGQQQRVAIARAIAAEPTLMLADEPTAALDPTTSADVIELLVREATRLRATLIISTHSVSHILDSVDRVIGLREGALVLDKPPSEVTDAALDDLYEGSRERI